MNLTLSKRGDYVVRSAIYLAHAFESGEPKKLREISSEMLIPKTFISQILGDLVRAKLAVSSFGRDGGFRLTRSPHQITVLEVVEAGEGVLIANRCALGDGPCHWESVCPLHESWSEATSSLRAVLATTTLATLVERDQAIKSRTYPIPDDSHRFTKHGVAINDVVQIERPLTDVTSGLAARGALLSAHAVSASEDGEDVLMRVGPGGPLFEKTVTVHLGLMVSTPQTTSFPIAWEATGLSGLFPRLEGTLTMTALDPERTELSLAGRYRPPLGRAGLVLDEALLSRAAHATIRSFLRRVARDLEGIFISAPTPDDVASRPPVAKREVTL